MMVDTSTYLMFVAGALLLLVTPGPAVFYVVARSVDEGRLAGVVSCLGIGVGTLFHIAAAALGISAVLVRSAVAFNLLKYAGAAYLIFLGVRKLREKTGSTEVEIAREGGLRAAFREGVLVNILNPKTALFFFAFLPQFVDAGRGGVALQVIVLGMTLVILGLFSDMAYAVAAGSAAGWIRGNARFQIAQRYFAGSVYIGLGLAAAFVGTERR